jgi:hypothetical protein
LEEHSTSNQTIDCKGCYTLKARCLEGRIKIPQRAHTTTLLILSWRIQATVVGGFKVWLPAGPISVQGKPPGHLGPMPTASRLPLPSRSLPQCPASQELRRSTHPERARALRRTAPSERFCLHVLCGCSRETKTRLCSDHSKSFSPIRKPLAHMPAVLL